jgi:hypothetical protein
MPQVDNSLAHRIRRHRRRFVQKLARNITFAVLLVFWSLVVGAVGYHLTQGLPWIDSFLNASMILTGMGPVDQLTNTSAKLFAIFYAIFSGTVFLTTAALVLVPVAHHVLHRFHLELEEDQGAAAKPPEKQRPDPHR